MFGLRSRFGFVIGGPAHGPREVDVYAAGRWLTCDDSRAYVPQFRDGLMRTIGGLLEDGVAERFRRPYPELSPEDNHRRLWADAEAGDNAAYLAYRFMDWGPTTDNVIAHLFLENDTALIPFSFWRPTHHEPSEREQVFLAELPQRELLRVLHGAAWELMAV